MLDDWNVDDIRSDRSFSERELRKIVLLYLAQHKGEYTELDNIQFISVGEEIKIIVSELRNIPDEELSEKK